MPLWTAGRLQAAEWARGAGGVGHRPPGRASEGGSRRPQTAWVRVLGLRGRGGTSHDGLVPEPTSTWPRPSSAPNQVTLNLCQGRVLLKNFSTF